MAYFCATFMQELINFPSKQVRYLFDSHIDELFAVYTDREIVLVTDANIAKAYPQLFKNKKYIVIEPGEAEKEMPTVAKVIEQLLHLEITRQAVLVGIGGGVVTDLTGFIASVYMRGISFGFVPTSLLAMVDAAIGGKNGVNSGLHKNSIGTITQPDFILFDTSFLKTLPIEEWSNGFAEIIKYALIFDAPLFDELAQNDLGYYLEPGNLNSVMERCVRWKNKTVIEDERERGIRKLLNFGHTIGHAIENQYALPHGKAVAIGMVIAAHISESVAELDSKVSTKLKDVLNKYQLPTAFQLDVAETMKILKSDKKRVKETIDFIILKQIGVAEIHPISLATIERALALWC